jgi:tetratricopeptide (TPR) repeat protein
MKKAKLIILLFICLWVFADIFRPSICYSETKVFIREYLYQASEADSKISSRAIALEQVKKLLLEELGTYLESQTEIRNFQLIKDQVTAITAGIVNTEIINEKWDGATYWIKAKIAADPNEVIKNIEAIRKDSQKSRALEESNKNIESALKDIESLKKELDITKADKNKMKEYEKNINKLKAVELFRKEISSFKPPRTAIDNYTEILQLDPQFAMVYVYRGVMYGVLGQHRLAIDDYGRAIAVDPNIAKAYANRSYSHSQLGKFHDAIEDAHRAIELDRSDPNTYLSLGLGYEGLERYREAIDNYTKAIDLDQKYAPSYALRGKLYKKIGDAEKGENDLIKAQELGYIDPEVYKRFIR